ncbi:MAG: hypothetical protein R3C45_21505 [Phycisphaerales bacterium]
MSKFCLVLVWVWLIMPMPATVLCADTQVTDSDKWTTDFGIDPSELSSTGRNPYFILEPGYQLYYEDGEDSLTITVLDETRRIDNIETRVVEEREISEGELAEVSRNFYAISTRNNSVFYFGEEVDIYKDGKVVKHEGAWVSGQDGARFGLMMPGQVLIGGRHYQEIAPGVAMDRAEIISQDETRDTPIGAFEHCLKVLETTPLSPREREFKYYAPGVGLVQEQSLKLVRYGMTP